MKSNRAYILMEAACLLTVLLWALTAFSYTHPVYQQIGTDNGIFLCMGRGIIDGLTPYVDITENKGPLFFLMIALAQLCAEGTLGVYILEILVLVGNCVLVMLCTRWLMGGRRNILCVAAALTLMLRTCGQHNYCEEYDYFFMLLSFAVLVHTFTGQRRGASARAFVLGLATAAVALIKLSDAPGLAALCVVYFVHVLRSRGGFWKELLRYALGAAVLAVPTVVYLCSVGALGAMFEEYIINNFVHAATAKDAGFWEIRRWLIFEDGYGWDSLEPVLMMAGAIVIRRLAFRADPQRLRREKPLLAGAALMAVGNLLCAYVAGTGFRQHLLMGYATMLIACVLGLSALLEWLNTRAGWLRWPELLAAAGLMLLVAVPATQRLAQERMAAARAAAEANHAAQCELLPDLEMYETVYTIGVSTDWYWHVERQPAFRYYNIVGFAMDNVGVGVEYEFEEFLTQGGIEALVTNGDIERFRGPLTNGIVDYIQNNYQFYAEDSSGRWLWTQI